MGDPAPLPHEPRARPQGDRRCGCNRAAAQRIGAGLLQLPCGRRGEAAIRPRPRGMGSSIAAGIMALDSQTLGAFIVPGDMPFLTSALLKDLIATFSESRSASIVYPATLAGEQLNPVLWPRRFFPLLASLSGSGGAKHLLAASIGSQKPVPVVVECAFADIDLPADLETARSQWRTVNP